MSFCVFFAGLVLQCLKLSEIVHDAVLAPQALPRESQILTTIQWHLIRLLRSIFDQKS
jgi:hypothetical protein